MLTRRQLIAAACTLAGAALCNALSHRWHTPAHEATKFDLLSRLARGAEAVQKSWQVRMKKRELLARLARLGPLPDDATVTQAQLDEFLDIVERIDSTTPDPDYIRPLLNTFGYGDGYGGYTHGAWALLKQDRAAVVEAALDTLETGDDGPRQWAMETLQRVQELRNGDGTPPPPPREVICGEAALTGPPLLAEAAVLWAYWVGGAEGRRLLELASRVSTGGARRRAVELSEP